VNFEPIGLTAADFQAAHQSARKASHALGADFASNLSSIQTALDRPAAGRS
jgi:hypothetical protein